MQSDATQTIDLPAIRRLTSGEANDQLLYFTSNSLTADDATLVFISDRDSAIPKESDPRSNVNLYALDRPSGEVRRLTNNADGYLRSYVYFEGLPYRGLGLASPSLHAPSGDLYYVQGREVRCVNARTGRLHTLALLPEGHVTGFTHVSDDNSRVCVPTIDAAAFQDVKAIDATVQRLGLTGHVRVFDTRTGAEVLDVEVPRGWVTHVQFRPGRNDQILFNHEWPCESAGTRRIWLWDGARIQRVRGEGQNGDGTWRSADDWVCHEVWSPSGRSIVYHGTYTGPSGPRSGTSFVGRVTPGEDDHVEVPLASDLTRYGHFSAGPGVRTLVSDGYAEFPELPLPTPSTQQGDLPILSPRGRGGQWISLVDVNWNHRSLAWRPVCRHGSSWSSQDAHPHPIFNHAGDEVLFTSDASGQRAVYAAPVLSPPP